MEAYISLVDHYKQTFYELFMGKESYYDIECEVENP